VKTIQLLQLLQMDITDKKYYKINSLNSNKKHISYVSQHLQKAPNSAVVPTSNLLARLLPAKM
jgi:hypothetical protein